MTDTEILHILFKKDRLVPITKNEVKLGEPEHKDCPVSIYNLPNDAVCLKADTVDMRELFQGSQHECKRADYIIFSESRKNILLIELKRTKDSWQGICQQLHGAACLARYCTEIGRTFWRKADFLSSPAYSFCFVSISQTVIGKGRSKETTKESSLDQNTQVKKISHPHHLQYPKLIA